MKDAVPCGHDDSPARHFLLALESHLRDLGAMTFVECLGLGVENVGLLNEYAFGGETYVAFNHSGVG